MLIDTNRDEAAVIAERVRAGIESQTLAYGMEILNITASLGVSSLRGNENMESFIKRADAAMYKAKQSGRNRVCAA